jgi:hypothetical protein
MNFNNDSLGNLSEYLLTSSFSNIQAPYGLAQNPSLPSLNFDANTGWIDLVGTTGHNIAKQTITDQGYYQIDIDGSIFSSDRHSTYFWKGLEGATNESVVGINFDGGLGHDTLILGNQEHSKSFRAIADDTIKIDGQIFSESIFLKASDLSNQGSITASNVNIEFSHSYIDIATAKIAATNGGNILLNGGKKSTLEANGQFIATGFIGGKIDFRAKTVSLIGAKLNADGEQGGGTILIGGDYQGTSSGTLINAKSTSVDQYATINASAIASGHGGKVIIWSDVNTEFDGSIIAHAGIESGNGGFVEVSGKKNLSFAGTVNVNAVNGEIGNVLLDPENIVIQPDDRDKRNKENIDIRSIQNIQGNLTLAATNNITLNTDAFFVPSVGTITLRADSDQNGAGSVTLLGYLWAGLRDINISGASIRAFGRGAIFSNAEGGSGNIRLTSQREIDFGQSTIFSESSGSSGDIILKAGTTITTGYLSATGKVRGGDVKLSAEGDILTSNIRSFSDGEGGDISVVSTEGKITTTNGSAYGEVPYISSSGKVDGGNIKLSAKGDILTSSIRSFSDGEGGDISVVSTEGKITTTNGSAYGEVPYISSSGKVDGGNIKLSAKGDILTSSIRSFSDGEGGDISVVSTEGKIIIIGLDVPYISSSGYGQSGKAGSVTLKAYGDIVTNDIYTESRSSNLGGAVKLITQTGKIDTNGKSIVTYSGEVTLKSAKDIRVGDIIASAPFDRGVAVDGGDITLLASDGNIDTGYITSASRTGAAGIVKLMATGKSIQSAKNIKVGDISANSSASGDLIGNGGKVTLKASGNIDAGNITSASRNGDGGSISVTISNGNITSGYLRSDSDSVDGNGGNITVDAEPTLGTFGGTVRVINTVNINGADFSIFAGINGDPKIKISYFPPTFPSADPGVFTIGDATVNGTVGIVMAGTDVIVDTMPIEGIYTLGNIRINTIIQAADDPLLAKIKKRVEKSYLEAYIPIAAYVTIRQTVDGTGIPALVSYIPEIIRLQVARELTITAASLDPEYSGTDKLKLAGSAFFDIDRILNSASKFNVTDLAQIAYILSSASHESLYGTIGLAGYPSYHNPLREFTSASDDRWRLPEIQATTPKEFFNRYYANSNGNGNEFSGDGYRYRGRGYIQLTGKENYEKIGNDLGVDLISSMNPSTVNRITTYTDESDPDKVATDRKLAADILVYGMYNGIFTGLGLNGLVSNSSPNFINARKIVNDISRENFSIRSSIANGAKFYLDTLQNIKYNHYST